MNITAAAPPVSREEASVFQLIARIPAYLKLLFGMLRDRRVSGVDRALVIASLIYVVSPLDFLPDVIPVLGQIDDLFLITFTLGRLFERASRDVVLSHWGGAPEELDPSVLRKLLYFASLFAPPGRRGRLRRLARGAIGT